MQKFRLEIIGALFIHASDEHNTVVVAKTIYKLEAENLMRLTGKLRHFSINTGLHTIWNFGFHDISITSP